MHFADFSLARNKGNPGKENLMRTFTLDLFAVYQIDAAHHVPTTAFYDHIIV